MEQWYGVSWTQVIQKLNTDSNNGLKSSQVEEIRKNNGSNLIEIKKDRNLKYWIFRGIRQGFFTLGIPVAALLIYVHNYLEAILIMIAMLCLIFYRIYGFIKSEREIKYLNRTNQLTALVNRDGRIERIPFSEIVTGDIVMLQKGNTVPADMRIIESNNLQVNEAAITGENYLIDKYEAKLEGRELNLVELRNLLFRNSVISEGEAVGVVFAVGEATQIGQLMNNVSSREDMLQNMDMKLTVILNFLSVLIFLSGLVFTAVDFLKEKSIGNTLGHTAAMYFAVVPSGVIFAYMIYVNCIRKILNQANVSVEKLSTIENIAGISAIEVDKIGAVSEKSMIVKELFYDNNINDAFLQDIRKDYSAERLLHIGILCNNCRMIQNESASKVDAFELGIIEYCADKLIYKYELEKEQPRFLEIPYDSERKLMTSINKVEDNYRANVKGSVEVLLDCCTHIMKDGIEKEISAEDIENIKNADIDMSSRGLAVVGFAYRNFNYLPSVSENIESYLVFVGLIGFDNPLKDGVYDMLDQCKNMGVRPIIFTEDSKLSAFSLGDKLGIKNTLEHVLSGIEIDNIDADELSRAVKKTSIFSRVSPQNKAAVTEQLNKSGYIVAYMGSVLTDLIAMQKCQVRIAVGKACPGTLRTLCDIYIADNYLESILSIIQKCKAVIRNIEKTLFYILFSIILESSAFIFSSLFGANMPMNLMQSLWINFLFTPLSVYIILSSEGIKPDELLENSDISNKVFRNKKGFKAGIYASAVSLAAVLLNITVNFFWSVPANITYLGIILAQSAFVLRLSPITEKKKAGSKNLFLFLNTILAIISAFLL